MVIACTNKKTTLMEQTNETSKRPVFLTVLCILTWVGCAIGLVGAIGSIGMSSAASGMSTQMQSTGDPELDRSMAAITEASNSAMKYASMISWINLLCIVACALGAFFMWQLKKTGFYIYTAGELIPVVASIALLGSMPGGGLFAGLGMIAAIIPVAFVVMYGLNLKHMK